MPDTSDSEPALRPRSEAATGSPSGVPVVDLGLDRPCDPAARAAAAQAVGQACATGGYFVAVGHGIPPAAIAAAYEAASRFFDEPDDVKDALSAEARDPLQRGFIRGDLEKFSLSRLGEPLSPSRHSTEDPALLIPNKWPHLDDFRQPCLEFYAAVESLAQEITRLFAIALDLPTDWFDDKYDNHMTQLAINHYKPNATAFANREFRNDPHQDWGTLTLLHQGYSDGGLQVFNQAEQWLDVPSRPDSFVVHIGDLMARWTNDRWTSAIHRVLNATEEQAHHDRTSLAFFYQPNHDAIIECVPTCVSESNPAKYPPVTSYNYIAAKVRRAFVVGRLAETGRTTQQVGAANMLRSSGA
jgi:isopenicillin N synthase-like dioxygenase